MTVSLVKGAWVVGHNLAGYLPESDVSAFATWQDAVSALRSEMRDYADTDDDATYDVLVDIARAYPTDYPLVDGEPDYGDDAPSMLAQVGAVWTDDGPRDGEDWCAILTDGQDRPISFWIMWAERPASWQD